MSDEAGIGPIYAYGPMMRAVLVIRAGIINGGIPARYLRFGGNETRCVTLPSVIIYPLSVGLSQRIDNWRIVH